MNHVIMFVVLVG